MSERWRPSVTVAAIVAESVDGEMRYLLVEEQSSEGLCLNNPAGHLEPGESPIQAVAREALEETGRVFSPRHLVGVYLSRYERPATAEDVTYVRLAFAGEVGAVDPTRTLDAGIVRTLWLTLAELRECRARHRSALVLRCIEDFAAGQAFPLAAVVTDPTVFSPEVKR